jgi:hypothetical protein
MRSTVVCGIARWHLEVLLLVRLMLLLLLYVMTCRASPIAGDTATLLLHLLLLLL